MKTLTEADIIRIMREEWDKKVSTLCEGAVGVKITAPEAQETGVPVVSPELKVRHKNSGIRYTISSVSPRDVILRTPEGKEFLVDPVTFEDEYILD